MTVQDDVLVPIPPTTPKSKRIGHNRSVLQKDPNSTVLTDSERSIFHHSNFGTSSISSAPSRKAVSAGSGPTDWTFNTVSTPSNFKKMRTKRKTTKKNIWQSLIHDFTLPSSAVTPSRPSSVARSLLKDAQGCIIKPRSLSLSWSRYPVTTPPESSSSSSSPSASLPSSSSASPSSSLPSSPSFFADEDAMVAQELASFHLAVESRNTAKETKTNAVQDGGLCSKSSSSPFTWTFVKNKNNCATGKRGSTSTPVVGKNCNSKCVPLSNLASLFSSSSHLRSLRQSSLPTLRPVPSTSKLDLRYIVN